MNTLERFVLVAGLLASVAASSLAGAQELTGLHPDVVTIQVNAAAPLTVQLSAPAPVAMEIALASSNGAVATVPASATIPPGQSSGQIEVQAISAGQATITATLGASTFQSTVHVQSAAPAVPVSTPHTLQLSIVTLLAAGAFLLLRPRRRLAASR